MSDFFTKLIAAIMTFFTWLGMILFPAPVPDAVFPDKSAPTEKSVFDEGEFVMGKYDIIVSPDGKDSNEGTLEMPLKTPAAAKEKAKLLETDETVTIWFREGVYFIENTLEFTQDDKENVIYRSFPNEKVIFSGAKEISGWSETSINGVKAFVTDIPIENDDDYFRSLFKEEKRLPRSNYPKEGVFKVADPRTDEGIPSAWSSDFFTHQAAFCAYKENLMNFENPEDIDIRLMHFWCDELMPVHSVDTETGRIEVTKPSAMTIRIDDNFVFENVKEALSLPGEWYLDRNEEKLYYIPEDGDTVENTVLYAGYSEQLITINNTSDIAFQGIEFRNTDWNHFDGNGFPERFESTHPLYGNIKYNAAHPQAAFETPAAIYITESSEINFTDCLFENISYTAVKFDKATTDCNVTSCMFNEIGANAVFIHGQHIFPASTRNINVTDCHISRYGRIFNNAIGILLTFAENCDLSNNEIHDGWYTGISIGWLWGYADNPTNNINISNNLIYNIGNGWLSDMGGIYTLGIQPDTVISGNVIYNVGCYDGEYGYGGWGIYLDEGSSGILVENNLVYDCSSQCFHQHYGKDNMIRNNIFAFGGEGQFRITKNEEHNSLFLYNNILVGEDNMMYWDTTNLDWFIDNENLYYDYVNGANVYSGKSMKLTERINIPSMVGKGYYNNAVFADPLFLDAENRDFTLALNSPALENGFVPFEYNAGTITNFN